MQKMRASNGWLIVKGSLENEKLRTAVYKNESYGKINQSKRVSDLALRVQGIIKGPNKEMKMRASNSWLFVIGSFENEKLHTTVYKNGSSGKINQSKRVGDLALRVQGTIKRPNKEMVISINIAQVKTEKQNN
ncbi:hypothetical protein Q3G72_014593 [Acer saccharum]|nr:hypothetical protein Q3G72_014593 [Acer saccharum]